MPNPLRIRLFARLRSNGFDCECPGCGKVYIVRPAARTVSAMAHNRKQALIFDESCGIFQCMNRKCRRAYQVGLNFHQIRNGVVPKKYRRVPVDTVPTVEQAAELKRLEAHRSLVIRAQLPSAFVVGREHGPPGAAGPVNSAEECTCVKNWRGEGHSKLRDAGCPRHGTGGGDDESTHTE